MCKNLKHRIKRKLTKLRLQPIRAFCFHQVSEDYNPKCHCQPDWMPLCVFKEKIEALKKDGYTFLSLPDAYFHIKHDKIRIKKYAVLTCDDGLMCQIDLLPWLKKEAIPLTLFVNIATLDGLTCGENMKRYFQITSKEIEEQYASRIYASKETLKHVDVGLVSIGIHGYSHKSVTDISTVELHKEVNKCKDVLSQHEAYIPFYAYAYGHHTQVTDQIIVENQLVPVLMDGKMNYNQTNVIHRELL